MEYFGEQLVNGVVMGGVYALIALGYTLIYGVLQFLNLAHGEMYMMGAFFGFFTMTALGGPSASAVPVVVMIGVMFVVAMGGGALLGVAVERFAYRPLRKSSRLAPLISALGVSLFLQNAALLLFGARVRLYDTGQFIDLRSGISIGRINIDPTEMMVVIGALLLMLGLWLMVNRTRLGRAMRAVAVDQDAAVMNGIDVDRTVVWTFAIASALAGAAGVMSGLLLYPVDQYMGVFAGLKGFSAAVLGGIGSIPGAMLGGFLLGITEALVTGYLNPTYADFIAFLILILVLLIRPRGILGRPAIAKV
ncbi:MAG: branched-chain amino acid ABC transporter permease [Candidatus Nanopelagicales bacterium]